MSTSSRRTRGAQREQLVESHLPLVRSIAKRYAGRGEMLDDLVQVGSVGLVRASKHFESGRGVSFAKFAAPAIEGEIRRHLDDRTTSVRVPRDLQRLSTRLERFRTELRAELGRAPSATELAQAMGVASDDVERALSVEQTRQPISTTAAALDEGEGDSHSVASIDDRLLLADGARVLSKRDRRIVFMRFHADMTESDIARELGISQAQVSKLLARALEKLRKELNAQNADPLGAVEADTDENHGEMAQGSRQQTGSGQIGSAAKARKPNPADPALPYHVTVTQDPEGGWTAALEELPNCRAGGATADEALERLRAAMQGWLSAGVARQSHVELPKQDVAKSKQGTTHSGRFLVRMPASLHEELSQAAERQHVSLNRFVNDTLAAAISLSASNSSPEPDQAVASSPSRRKRLRMLVMANVVVTVLAAAVAVTLLILALERGI